MVEYLIIGMTFGFAAAAQPGPLQAYLFSQVAAHGWRRTLPAVLCPLISDGPIALIALYVLNQSAAIILDWLRLVGGILLLYFACRTWLQAGGQATDPTNTSKPPRTLVEAAWVNALNPGPWLGWSLILGPQAVQAWDKSPAYAIVLIAAFYCVLLTGLAGFVALTASSALLSSNGRRVLARVAAAILAALGVYFLALALGSLVAS